MKKKKMHFFNYLSKTFFLIAQDCFVFVLYLYLIYFSKSTFITKINRLYVYWTWSKITKKTVMG